MNKKKNSNGELRTVNKTSLGSTVKAQFQSREFKNGSYSMLMVVIVVVIAVLINMIIGQLPESLTQPDLSSTKIYETGEVTASVVEDLQHEVKILVVVENDSLDSRIEKFLNRYAELSDKITVEYRDPVLHPDVLTEYGVSSNTILVSCEDTGKTETIQISSMIEYDQYYYYYYGQYVETSFDGEGLLTSAIDYVSTDSGRVVYTLGGHGESDLNDTILDVLDKSNLSMDSLDLLQTTEVPQDCSLLVINAPTADLADDELTQIRNYLQSGGNVMLLRSITENTLENFDALMEEFGLTMVNEYIGDTERFYQAYRSYYNFFPVITSASANIDSDSTILVSSAAGMTKAEETPEDVSITELLTTGTKAFAGNDTANLSKYLLGARSVKTYAAGSESEEILKDDTGLMTETVTLAEETEEEIETESETEAETAEDETEEDVVETTTGTLTVLTVSSMIDSSIIDRFSNLGNVDEFTSLVTSLFDDVSSISIPSKSLEVTYNTVTNSTIWSVLFLLIIPIFCIINGLYIWLKRRKA